MKWTLSDIDMYLGAKEYVDTAVIPLLPISWKTDLKNTAAMGEFIMFITTELERQFKGRLFVLPAFTYLKSEDSAKKIERLNDWAKELVEGDVKHVVFVTSDPDWKQVEDKLQDTLLWLPKLPIEHLEQKYKDEMLKDQLDQIMPIFINKWKK